MFQNINIRFFFYILSFLSIIFVTFIIFYLFVCLQFSEVILCDDNGWTLYQLKVRLTHETTNFRTSVINYAHYTDLYDQLMGISRPNFRNFYEESRLLDKISSSRIETTDALDRVRALEHTIKRLEPGFTSAITPNHYVRVGRA